jgi:hypothetical protein
VNDHHELAARQEKFNQDVNKIPFKFNCKMFDLPQGSEKAAAQV